MINFVVFAEASVEYLKDGVKGVLDEDIGVVTSNKLIWNDDELRIILDVCGVDGVMVRRDRVLYFLQGVTEWIFKEISDLVLFFIENFL